MATKNVALDAISSNIAGEMTATAPMHNFKDICNACKCYLTAKYLHDRDILSIRESLRVVEADYTAAVLEERKTDAAILLESCNHYAEKLAAANEAYSLAIKTASSIFGSRFDDVYNAYKAYCTNGSHTAELDYIRTLNDVLFMRSNGKVSGLTLKRLVGVKEVNFCKTGKAATITAKKQYLRIFLAGMTQDLLDAGLIKANGNWTYRPTSTAAEAALRAAGLKIAKGAPSRRKSTKKDAAPTVSSKDAPKAESAA